MSADVERVARALYELSIRACSDPKPKWEDSGGWQDIMRERAEVAIAAMQGSDTEKRERCRRCGGNDGNHGLVHIRHGNGGGHNERCPLAPEPDAEAIAQDIESLVDDMGDPAQGWRAGVMAAAEYVRRQVLP